MASPARLPFKPDYAIPPGQTLLETLESIGMSQAELARRTNRPIKTINEIVQGKAAIIPETAIQLERVLGLPSQFWLNMEANYRQALAEAEERKRLATDLSWLDEIPVRSLIKLGLVSDVADAATKAAEVLKFFRVANPQAWRRLWAHPVASLRESPAFRSNPGAVATWLRLAEMNAEHLACQPFDANSFRSQLPRIRNLSVKAPAQVQEQLIAMCSQAGVAVSLVPELPGTHVSGATRWLSSDKALLGLSDRYKTDDQFWFSFFHESGHILLHGKRETFVDGVTPGVRNPKEQDADRFASELLVPNRDLEVFLVAGPPTEVRIVEFADELGVAPSIVLGRLQHAGHVSYSEYPRLKRPVHLVSAQGSTGSSRANG